MAITGFGGDGGGITSVLPEMRTEIANGDSVLEENFFDSITNDNRANLGSVYYQMEGPTRIFSPAGGIIRLNSLSTFGTPFTAGVVTVSPLGERTVVASDEDGNIATIDISDPTAPATIGTLAIGGSSSPHDNMEMWGHWGLYRQENENALKTIDFSDPANPSVVNTLAMALDIVDVGDRDMAISPSATLFVNDRSNPRFVDVTDPTSPSIVNTFTNGIFFVNGVFTANNRFIQTNGGGTVGVWDVSDPADPTNIFNHNTGWDSVGAIAVADRHVYIGDRAASALAVADPLADSAADFLVWRNNGTVNPVQIRAHGLFAHIGRFNGDFTTVYMGDPFNPIEVGNVDLTDIWDLETFASGICVCADLTANQIEVIG